jgi:hypothetical protein
MRAGSRPDVGRTLYRVWTGACGTALIVLIGIRFLRYASVAVDPSVDRLLREAMVIEQQLLAWPWVYSIALAQSLLLGVIVVVAALHRRLPGRLVTVRDGRWQLTALGVSIALGVMVWVQYLFDLDTTVAMVCAASLVLTWVTGQPRVATVLRRSGAVAVWIAFFVCALFAARDAADRIAILVWAGVLLATHALAPRIGGRDLMLVRVLAALPMNLLPTMLPLAISLHGGTLLGDGLAYSFCEVPNRGVLYAAIPVCGSVRAGYDECRDGRVVEYDLATMKAVAEHRFFSPSFHGRLEQMMCLDDEVQVAVQAAVYQNRPVVQGVLAFPADDPGNFRVLTAEAGGIGTNMAYDAAHDAIFYSGEFNNPLVRFDRRTHQFDDAAGRDLLRRWYEPVALKANSGSLTVQSDSIHPARNRMYLADWMQGRYAYAVDLTTLRVVARYDVGGGGAMGISVDPERDRLFVSSMWGLEVVDLATDTIVARMRTGLGNRPVVVDRARNRLYVNSMVDGKIRILDRDTFAQLGQIPIGFGCRYVHLSRDGRYLIASSAAGQFHWDAETLAPR